MTPEVAAVSTELEVARLAADTAADRQAEDVVLLDISRVSSFADYFVIFTATSERHLKSLAEQIDQRLSEEGVSKHHIEGTPESGWILLDYGNLIVHAFAREVRDRYRLERLWSDATTLLRLQ